MATLEDIQNKIVAKRFDAALSDLDALLEDNPDNADALYMSAVCRRYLRDYDESLRLLAKLIAITPENGRAHQEEGHTWRDRGEARKAVDAYARACRFNPALVASWREQMKLLHELGQTKSAEHARSQLEYLQGLPKPLLAVIDLVSQGRLLKAEDICRQFLQKVPHHVEAMRLLADIGVRFGALDDAEFLLAAARKLDPENLRVRIDYVHTLRKRQKFEQALEEARSLLATSPENPQFRSICAIELMQTGNYEEALALFDAVLDSLPGDPVTLTSRGHALKTCGRYEEAVDAYRSAIASQPRHGEAYYSLSNLKVYEFDDDELAGMRAQYEDPTLPHADRIHVSFALGKACEDRGDFADSYRYYAEGNRLKKLQTSYDAQTMSDDLAAQRRICTRELLSQGQGHEAPDPIFVVGLPRAGSTLIEQILSSHSQIDGTLELPNILSLSQQLRRRGRSEDSPPYPELLASLSDEERVAFGRRYIEDTRVHRQGAPYFIDKMPNNFRHIGLIQLILPNATIIDARRHPMACCFSGYKQLFAEGQEFTYDLADLGRYYRDYVELMDHWDTVIPGKVLRVQYEDVVADLETQVGRMLKHCGLEFEAACVEYHRTDRSVRTPSSEQVRRPIFRSGIDYWRNYEAWLDPLKQSLGEDLRHRYDVTLQA